MANNALIMSAGRGASFAGAQPPSDQNSILRQIAGKVLSPLAAVGNFLDLPGSSVRDVLTGQNPFDQYLTPTKSDNRATGRDFLARYGIAKPNDPHRWEAADVGGFLAEVALDPTTYLTGGLSGLGKALQGTGKATHLFKATLPFTRLEAPFGKAAAQLIDKGASKVWNTKLGKVAAQTGSMLFDPKVKGMFDPMAQNAARTMSDLAENSAPDAALKALDDLEFAKPAYKAFQGEFSSLPPDQLDKTWKQAFQHAAETAPTGDYQRAFSDAVHRFTGQRPSQQLTNQVAPVLERWHTSRLDGANSVREWGGKVGEIGGKISHAHRRVTKQYINAKKESMSGGGLLSTPAMKPRRKVFAWMTQDDVEKLLAKRASYTGPNGAKNIEADFGNALGYTTKKGRVVKASKHAEKLSKWLEDVPNNVSKIYDLAPEALHADAIEGYEHVRSNLEAIHQILADNITTGKGVSLKRAFQVYGMDVDAALNKFADITGRPLHEVDKMRVDGDMARAIKKVLKANTNPEWLGVLGEMVDKFNRTFKQAVTLPFPSFHIRNFISGQHMNLASKHFRTFGDYLEYSKSLREAWELRKLGTSSHKFKEAVANGMAPSHVTTDDVELLSSDNVAPPTFNPLTAGPAAYQQAKQHVSQHPEGEWLGGVDALLPNSARTWMNTPNQAGSNVARATEFMNRMPMYLYLRKKGLSAKEAAKEVNALQFDYSRSLSPFEKNIARRLVPFYGFTKNIVPQTFRMLLDAPGGKLAQTIRASNAGRGAEDVMPAHIAGTAAIPLNPLEDGTKRYVTGFGLAPEAAVQYLSAPTDPGGALQEALSATTPLVKYPLELATGQTFFQKGPTGAGRSLSDLDPTIGRIMSNVTGQDNPVMWAGSRDATMAAEHAIANTPLSRFLTTARTLSDPRKWREGNIAGVPDALTNVLTPTRVSNVSPQQQERLVQAASNELANSLGAGTWTNRYFSKENLERMTPEQRQVAEALKQIWSQNKRNAAKSGGKKSTRSKKKRVPVNALLRAAGR